MKCYKCIRGTITKRLTDGSYSYVKKNSELENVKFLKNDYVSFVVRMGSYGIKEFHYLPADKFNERFKYVDKKTEML